MKPIEVSDVLLAFPANVEHLMPCLNDIPDSFKKDNNPWSTVFYEFFYYGNKKNISLIPRQDIEVSKAWRHICCIMYSFQPKHEHKEAACCYLFDLWFADAISDFDPTKPGEYQSIVSKNR